MNTHLANSPSHNSANTNGTVKAASTTSVSTSSSHTASRPAESQPAKFDGAVIGGIVCGIVGALLMLAVAVYFILHNRKQRVARRKYEEERANRYGIPNTLSTAKNDHQTLINQFRMPPPPRPPPPQTSLSPSHTSYAHKTDNAQPRERPNIRLEERFRDVQSDMDEKWDDGSPVSPKDDQSSNLPILPIITITDQYLPIPAALLSPQPILESYEDHISSPEPQITSRTVSKGRSYSYLHLPTDSGTLIESEPSHREGINTRVSQPELTLQTTNLPDIQESEAELEKDPESPVLGVMNKVRISNGPQLTPIATEPGRSRSESDKSSTTTSTIDLPLITDEELERLGVGLRF
ncbi:hypothetical protein K3495_g7721 [Podosphaera aphanis]|nr:hypothetical protein K3495_g7721 [Podosphaera aphanis]